jgi:hypothetical protein
MIFRLSQNLSEKIKAGTLAALPLHDNPLTDWSAHLFRAGRTQYILLSNTQSLYSLMISGKGITNDSQFIGSALSGIRESMQGDGQGAAYERFIAPASGSVQFAKALNRSVTGSINDMTQHAAFWLTEGELSPFEEPLFGSHRYHERRASGRKQGSPGLVARGSVRGVASLATRLRPEGGRSCRRGVGMIGGGGVPTRTRVGTAAASSVASAATPPATSARASNAVLWQGCCPSFFGDLLEHLLVEHQLGDEAFSALDLALQFADTAGVIGLGGVMLLPPAVVGILGDAELAADIGDGQALGQVAVGVAKQANDLVGSPSLTHEFLLGVILSE